MEILVPLTYRLSHTQQKKARQETNLAIIGKLNCNIYNDQMNIIPDPTITLEQDTKLKEIHYSISRSKEIHLIIDFNPTTGEFKPVGFV